MKSIMLEKNVKKKLLVICCLVGSLFINCVSTYVEGLENNDQDLNSEFPGDFYIDPKERFSIVIPKGWRIYDLKIKYDKDELDSIFLMGIMAEYNVDSNCSLVHVNTSIPISEIVDEAFIKTKQLGSLVEEPEKENITIGTTDLHGEYIKMLRYRENDRKTFWQKVYYVPHQAGDAVMMITCSALLLDDNVDLDVVFDKFIKTFNWIR